jgi:hypothetical protein
MCRQRRQSLDFYRQSSQVSSRPRSQAGADAIERFLGDISAGIAAIGDDVGAAALALKDVPRVGGWLAQQLHDPELVEQWSIPFVKLACVLAAAMLADWLVDGGMVMRADQDDAGPAMAGWPRVQPADCPGADRGWRADAGAAG